MLKTYTLRLMTGLQKCEFYKCQISFKSSIGYPGRPRCVLHFDNKLLGHKDFHGADIFECFLKLREYLEKKGFQIICNGARIDSYSRGLARSMGGGFKVYRLKKGEFPKKTDLYETFSDTDPEFVGTISEQFNFYKEWVESISEPET